MTDLEMSNRDLECCCCISGDYDIEEEEGEGSGGSCFSDVEEGSCNSQFFSTADGDFCYDDCSLGSGVEISEDEDLESGVHGGNDGFDFGVAKMVDLKRIDRNCRICHLSLVNCSPSAAVSAAIELGCSCKDDLAIAHKQCAETWFKIRGNKTCEICNSVARNVASNNDIEAGNNESGGAATITVTATAATAETATCFNGQRFLNFLLACMVFAFVISWLFHFNFPS